MPQRVVRARLARGNWEVLVQWETLPEADASWEPLDDFKRRYPSVQLEDELFVEDRRAVCRGQERCDGRHHVSKAQITAIGYGTLVTFQLRYD